MLKVTFDTSARRLVGVFLNAAVLIAIWHEISAVAQGGGAGPVTTTNGDVNGDQAINLTDATYLLNWLFLNGPEPVPLAVSEGPLGLPDTGQTTCYDAVGNEIPCDSEDCAGQDGLYATGCPSEGRFADNGDGTVTDNCTGLIWQKETADTNGDGQVVIDGADSLPWCDALAYCENLDFAGHDDWRLPNVQELQSIVDYGRHNPSIDPVFGASHFSWSSTSHVGNPHSAWGINVGVVLGSKDRDSLVRAVRTAP